MDKGKEFSRLVAIELSAEGKRRGITHVQIAAAAGISPGMISYYIAGTKGDMTVATLLRAAQRLGISPQVIVERAYDVLTAGDASATQAPDDPNPADEPPLEPIELATYKGVIIRSDDEADQQSSPLRR